MDLGTFGRLGKKGFTSADEVHHVELNAYRYCPLVLFLFFMVCGTFLHFYRLFVLPHLLFPSHCLPFYFHNGTVLQQESHVHHSALEAAHDTVGVGNSRKPGILVSRLMFYSESIFDLGVEMHTALYLLRMLASIYKCYLFLLFVRNSSSTNYAALFPITRSSGA